MIATIVVAIACFTIGFGVGVGFEDANLKMRYDVRLSTVRQELIKRHLEKSESEVCDYD